MSTAQDLIPIAVSPTGHATVPVGLGSSGTFSFVLDTGAEGSAIYSTFATALGLEPTTERETLVGQTGQAEIPVVILPQLTLGDLTAKSLSAVVLPPRADGHELHGIVGLDVFGQSVLDFNFPSLRVGIHATGTRLAAMAGVQPLLASRTAGNLLTVRIRLNGEDAVAVIDTGARKSRINWVLGRKLGFSPDSLAAGDVIHGGTNTPLESGSSIIREVDIGGRQLSNAPALVADLPVFEAFGVDKRAAVILGLDWLRELRMVIDFPQQKIWFLAPK